MPPGRKLMPLTLNPQQHNQLEGVAHSTTMPYGVVLRARMILGLRRGPDQCGHLRARRCLAPSGRQVAPPLP